MIDSEVLCMKTNPGGAQQGSVYNIESVRLCSCGKVALDIGLDFDRLTVVICSCGQPTSPTRIWWHSASQFMYMEDIDISQLKI